MQETRLELIKQRLTTALQPTVLIVEDESAKHHGHPGASTGMGHFAVTIASPLFKDHNLLECHRLVYDALGSLMQTDIHALKLKIIT
ncbi:MAG: BolA family transcriptional regulator [Coxiellaceae bacterium]|nr:MAG: BolA family transcriptional regulator [Coxiellaceae bacterium]